MFFASRHQNYKIPAALIYFGMDALALETRRHIYRYIKKNPGVYLRELQKALQMPMGQLEYHLDCMAKHNVIVSRIKNNRKRYFAMGALSYEDQKLVALLKQKIPRDIVLFLLTSPYVRHRDIVSGTRYAPSTITANLHKLLRGGIAVFSIRNNEKLYKIKDESRVVRLLVAYEKTFKDTVVEGFVRRWAAITARFSKAWQRS
jgi:predicted transcriptional regulator